MLTTTQLQRLKLLLIATFLSSVLHYLDNILFFADYPEPEWINSGMVDLFWIVMTPLAPIAYFAFKRGAIFVGITCSLAYGLCNMLSLGHYNYAPFTHIDFKIHAFIFIETILAACLMGYVLAIVFANGLIKLKFR